MRMRSDVVLRLNFAMNFDRRNLFPRPEEALDQSITWHTMRSAHRELRNSRCGSSVSLLCAADQIAERRLSKLPAYLAAPVRLALRAQEMLRLRRLEFALAAAAAQVAATVRAAHCVAAALILMARGRLARSIRLCVSLLLRLPA